MALAGSGHQRGTDLFDVTSQQRLDRGRHGRLPGEVVSWSCLPERASVIPVGVTSREMPSASSEKERSRIGSRVKNATIVPSRRIRAAFRAVFAASPRGRRDRTRRRAARRSTGRARLSASKGTPLAVRDGPDARSYPTAAGASGRSRQIFPVQMRVLNAPALVAGLDDFAVMREAVQSGRGHVWRLRRRSGHSPKAGLVVVTISLGCRCVDAADKNERRLSARSRRGGGSPSSSRTAKSRRVDWIDDGGLGVQRGFFSLELVEAESTTWKQQPGRCSRCRRAR